MRGQGTPMMALSLAMVLLAGCEDSARDGDLGAARGATRTQESPLASAEPATSVKIDNGPLDENAEIRPDLLRLEPTAAQPGEAVALQFPRETTRGVCYVLEQSVDSRWHARFQLLAAPAGSTAEPSSAPMQAVFECNGIEVRGQGPDRIRLPRDAADGDYRVCTSNSRSNFCAELAIAGPLHPDAPEPEPPGPLHDDAVTDHDLVRVQPARVAPGDRVELRFPRATEREDALALERLVRDDWHHEWWLGSDRGDDGVRWSPQEHGFHWDGRPLRDKGPDLVEIPDDAHPGRYRICLLDEPHACAELEVIPP